MFQYGVLKYGSFINLIINKISLNAEMFILSTIYGNKDNINNPQKIIIYINLVLLNNV